MCNNSEKVCLSYMIHSVARCIRTLTSYMKCNAEVILYSLDMRHEVEGEECEKLLFMQYSELSFLINGAILPDLNSIYSLLLPILCNQLILKDLLQEIPDTGTEAFHMSRTDK